MKLQLMKITVLAESSNFLHIFSPVPSLCISHLTECCLLFYIWLSNMFWCNKSKYLLVKWIFAIRIVLEAVTSVYNGATPGTTNRKCISNHSPLWLTVECHYLNTNNILLKAQINKVDYPFCQDRLLGLVVSMSDY